MSICCICKTVEQNYIRIKITTKKKQLKRIEEDDNHLRFLIISFVGFFMQNTIEGHALVPI